MNIDIQDCKRWAYKESNRILNAVRETNWWNAPRNAWSDLAPALTNFVLNDDEFDVADKMIVVEQVINYWCSVVKSSSDANLPQEKRTNLFNRCRDFTSNLLVVLEKDFANELLRYNGHTVEFPVVKTRKLK